MTDNKPLQGTQATAPAAPPAAVNTNGTIPTTASGGSTSSPLHKRHSDDGENDINSNHKRPKVVLEESTGSTVVVADTTASTNTNSEDDVETTNTKTVVTPTSAAATSTTEATAASATTASATLTATATSPPKNSSIGETLDLAKTLGLRAGAQIEVQWEIHNDAKREEDTDAATATATPAAPSVSLHWWRATLLEHDGRTTDSVAIRTLHYEARPDLGFPEASQEDVVFLGKDVLVTSTDQFAEDWDANPDAVNQMPYRRVMALTDATTNPTSTEASTTRTTTTALDEVFYYSEDQLEEQLNTLLMGAFQKNQRAWNSMPAAQQAMIAETIQKKKTQLKEIIQEEAKKNNNQVITPETIKDILARTF